MNSALQLHLIIHHSVDALADHIVDAASCAIIEGFQSIAARRSRLTSAVRATVSSLSHPAGTPAYSAALDGRARRL